MTRSKNEIGPSKLSRRLLAQLLGTGETIDQWLTGGYLVMIPDVFAKVNAGEEWYVGFKPVRIWI